MAYERKNNTGSLFKNDKITSEKSPQYKGTVLIDGVEYWQSAWVKETKDNRKFFEQAFTRKDAPAEKPAPHGETNDEVPF